MNNFIRIESSDIKDGMRFFAPVFFDDGKNMLLAEGKTVKSYHIAALKRWAIPFLLTYGREIKDSAPVAAVPVPTVVSAVPTVQDAEDVEELEELEEV